MKPRTQSQFKHKIWRKKQSLNKDVNSQSTTNKSSDLTLISDLKIESRKKDNIGDES